MIGLSAVSHLVSRGFTELWLNTKQLIMKDDLAIAAIRRQMDALSSLPDQNLRQCVDVLRQAWPSGNIPPSAVIIESFSLLCASIGRTQGITLYDVQLRAGLAMTRQAIAEMQTGEGKTLAAALPAMSYALAGRGVHVMTVNDYLAERDFQLLQPAFDLLGVSIGLLREDASPQQKRAAYSCDVTYGPGHEFGFDYLRDQLTLMGQPRSPLGADYRRQLRGRREAKTEGIQRGHFFAVVDEADSVMIDEANTPLVLASKGCPAEDAASVSRIAMRAAASLMIDRDFVVDSTKRVVQLTQHGTDQASGMIDPNAVVQLQRPWLEYVRTALHAKYICQRNIDYVLDDNVVKLVDGGTGRVFTNRSWRDGLRQAVEVREGVAVTEEGETVARISRQRSFMLYDGMCGLTGTASESASEFQEVYGLPVVTIPPRTPSRRVVFPTRFFPDLASKWDAIAAEVERLYATGQPVLVGTRTVRDSESLARQLTAIGLAPQLLNGIQDAEEADVIARAGQLSAVTVATNMAGRGTDIQLGPGVKQLGGMHVIVCEPHESARVDRQLIGRAARQGDPGSCQLFVSAEDRVIALGSAELGRQMRRAAGSNGEIGVDFTAKLTRLQCQLERQAVSLRHKLVSHDDWLERIVVRLNGS